MSVEMARVNLLDESVFATSGGLWTGKKGPFATAEVIRNTNFTASGRIDYFDVALLQVEAKQLASRRLVPGDIIIERSGGGPTQPVGRVVLFERNDGVFSLSNFTARLRVIDTDRFDARFVFYYLLFFHDSGQTYHLQRRTTGIRNLDWRGYREAASVPLFECGEQRQIAAVLSAVQVAIERQERLIALAAELKKALMRAMFTEGTRGEPQKQTEIGLVPESWAVAPLARFTESFQYGTSVKCGYDPEGLPVLRIPNVVGGPLDTVDLKYGKPKRNEVETVRLRNGDLLFVRTNGVRENAGRCSMYRGELGDSCYFASYLIRVRLRRNELLPEFLEEYTRTETGVRLLAGRSIRTADGKFNINSGTLQTLLVPKPRIDEQEVIAGALGLVDAKARNHAASLTLLQSLFRTLLHQLMTAKVRVHDLDLSALESAPVVGAAGAAGEAAAWKYTHLPA